MDSLLSQLQSEWEGSASEAYAAKFEELRPSFVQAQELIESIAQSRDQSANSLEEADSNIASSWR